MPDHHNHQVGNIEGHSAGHSMKMYFHGGYNNIVVLFSSWKINSLGGLIGSWIGIFLLAIVYELLKVFREFLLRRSSKSCSCGNGDQTMPLRSLSTVSATVNEAQNPGATSTCIHSKPQSHAKYGHLIQTVLHMVQLTLSYFLMLIFMTFNVWLCLAVILGAGVGYFAFGWVLRSKTAVMSSECHV